MITDLLLGIPALIYLVLPPVGLYYSWKSIRLKQGHLQTRYLYLYGHLLFSGFLVFVIWTLVNDILVLFPS